jgi:Tol biopolymer transport system component
MPDAITAHPTHWQFSLARNSNLYFGSRKDGVRGEQDIYVARFDGQRYLEPEDVGPNINSEGQDLCPFIDPDERYLLFVRDRGTHQGADLFLSRRLEDGTWSEAQELPAPINSDGHDLCPVVTPDGRYLFFISNRSGESLVYWVKTGFLVETFPGGNP